ncbi:MAG TPA: hypothetical protein ENI26_00370 [Methylophaga aminisulfidivorans]|uniref:histidine kinase n=2 Tax=root TaxID=1 RepID=A0A7C1ZTW6_9GAMM|nr:hypothetical protein [Methylophaga aminisulfidivorans]
MPETKLHGYVDPSLSELPVSTIMELNRHAAIDLAKRTIPGGLIVLLALLISAHYSPIQHDYPLLTYGLYLAMVLVFLMRLYNVYVLLKKDMPITPWRRQTFIIFFFSSTIWGVYVAISLYLYETLFTNMVLLMFTVGIAAGALTSLFIWKRLTQLYLCMIFIPIIISTFMHWNLATVSILFGLISYMLFLMVQTNRANTEYWRSLCTTKIVQAQADELEKAIKLAETANNAKTEFLSSMSHELRTPLNAILGFTQLLKSDPQSPPNEQQKESLNHILTASNHLLTLVNQVLDLSKIESGHLDLHLRSTQIGDVVNDCLLLVQSLADKQHIRFVIAEVPAVEVHTDPIRLKQILINLLSNGIKYNREGGSLLMEFEQKEHVLRILIIDTGEGIAEKYHSSLFTNFSRLGQQNSRTEGSGVGLVITKRIIEEMGGKIGFESKVNIGSTFWFELPLSKTTS